MAAGLPWNAFDLDRDAVRSRFDWATRQGNPYWLWPDTLVDHWQEALCRIELITRQIMIEGASDQVLSGNAEATGIAAFTSGMGPLLGYWLGQGLFEADEPIAAIMDLHLRHNSKRMQRLARHATSVVEHLARRGVQATVLKGMQTAQVCFPVPGARPMSDIDLLVSPRDCRAAGAALAELDFVPGRKVDLPPQQCWRLAGTPDWPCSLSLTHADNGWYVDLQTALGRRYSAGAPMIALDLLLELEAPQPWALSAKAAALGPVSSVLHLACHASCGLENVTMIRLVELALVIRNGARSPGYWTSFAQIGERTGTLASAYPALLLSDNLVPGLIPEELLELARSRTPRRVRRVVAALTPANAQRVHRCSLEERFMWTSSWTARLRQIVIEILPLHIPWRELLHVYKMRGWRVLRGKLTRRARQGF